MDGEGKKLWVPDPEHGFKLGRMVDIGADSLTIEPFDAPGRVSFFLAVVAGN
jgi:myosin VI